MRQPSVDADTSCRMLLENERLVTVSRCPRNVRSSVGSAGVGATPVPGLVATSSIVCAPRKPERAPNDMVGVL